MVAVVSGAPLTAFPWVTELWPRFSAKNFLKSKNAVMDVPNEPAKALGNVYYGNRS